MWRADRGGRLEDAKSVTSRCCAARSDFEEIALAQMQLAAIEHALDAETALASIRRATEPGSQAGDESSSSRRASVRARARAGIAADALRTYERRAELERLAPGEPLARKARR